MRVGKASAEAASPPSFESRLIAGLTELRDLLAAGRDPAEVFTLQTCEVPEPPPFGPKAIRRIRTRLGASQTVFAKIVGSSAILVQSWEQGKRTPSPMARRLLQMIDAHPDVWAEMAAPKEVAGTGRITNPGGRVKAVGITDKDMRGAKPAHGHGRSGRRPGGRPPRPPGPPAGRRPSGEGRDRANVRPIIASTMPNRLDYLAPAAEPFIPLQPLVRAIIYLADQPANQGL